MLGFEMNMDGNYMCKIFRTKSRNQKYNKDWQYKKKIATCSIVMKKHSPNKNEERKIGVKS